MYAIRSYYVYYFIGDRTYQVVSGVLLLINMNEVHRLINSNGAEYERVTLLFKKEVLQSLLPEAEDLDLFDSFRSDSNAVKLRGHEQNFVEDLFDKIIREDTSNSTNSASSELYVRLMLMELLIFIKRKFDNGHNDYFIESNVITSYSIHYTKLYDFEVAEQAIEVLLRIWIMPTHQSSNQHPVTMRFRYCGGHIVHTELLIVFLFKPIPVGVPYIILIRIRFLEIRMLF